MICFKNSDQKLSMTKRLKILLLKKNQRKLKWVAILFQIGADAVIVIDKAFEDISELRRDLGSFEKNTLQSTLGNINSENLNSGRTRSMLQDADSASEMAELTQSQIQLSMSQSMIAQSHQKSKNVMKLIHS